MSCSFSKVKRRQCATLAFLEIILQNLSPDVCKAKKTRDCLERIDNRKHKLFHQITGVHSHSEMGHIKSNQYARMIHGLVDTVHGLPDNLIAMDWVNASIMILEEQYSEIPIKKAKYRREWAWLLGSLITLYSHFDNKLEMANSMKTGKLIGERVRKAVE